MVSENTILKIVSIGESHWSSGYTYALDACKRLKNANIHFQYTIFGGANDLELMYQVEDLGLQNEVILKVQQCHFRNVIDSEETVDVLLRPGIVASDPNLGLEAMALKVFVLSTDCDGLGDVIDDGVNGFLVPIRDSKAIADRLLNLSQLTGTEKLRITEAAYSTSNVSIVSSTRRKR